MRVPSSPASRQYGVSRQVPSAAPARVARPAAAPGRRCRAGRGRRRGGRAEAWARGFSTVISRSLVGDLDPQGHARPATGVLEGVAQPLLHDAVGLAGDGRAAGPRGRRRPWRSPAARPRGCGAAARRGRRRGSGAGAVPGVSPSLNTPRTASSSPTVRRVVSSIAASASRTNSGSLSRTRRAALAWRVTALRAWPTESCSSRASRLRTARSAARASAAASRSSGVGPSNAGAQRASSAPETAAQPASASSVATPATGASASTQGWSRDAGSSTASAPPSHDDQRQRGEEAGERRHRQRHPRDDPAEPEMQREPGRRTPLRGPCPGGPVGEQARVDTAQRPHGTRLQGPGQREQGRGEGGEGQPDREGEQLQGQVVEDVPGVGGGTDDELADEDVRHGERAAEDQMDPAPTRPPPEQEAGPNWPNRVNRLTPYDVSGSRSAPRGSGRRGRRRGCRRSSGQRR